MVEVAPKRGEIQIRYWKYLAFLAFVLFFGFLALWGLLGSQWGASNPLAEWFRRYLNAVNRFRPNAKPEDNLANALRLHGVEKIGDKRFALLFSVTDKNGDPLAAILPNEITIAAGKVGAQPSPAVVDRVAPLHMKSGWNDKISFASVMDYSGSMFPEDISAIENNYSSFINSLVCPYAATVIKFNNGVNEILPLSSNKGDIDAALKNSVPLQNTAFYEGMDKGISNIQARQHLRFVLLTTDGNDNRSSIHLDEVINRSRNHFVSAFVLGFGWLNVDVLKKIADECQGYYVYVPDSRDLKDWFVKMAKIVNNVQVAEFSTSTDFQLPESLVVTVTTGGTTLSKTR